MYRNMKLGQNKIYRLKYRKQKNGKYKNTIKYKNSYQRHEVGIPKREERESGKSYISS